jgi:uncharacterized membrane protein YeaQ/YmgE (transglycosylase-associated protein family)
MQIINLILLGLLVGLAAKLLFPGKDPGGFVITILLGIAGSFIGVFLGSYMNMGTGWLTGLGMAVSGAMLLLLLYRAVRSATAST